jgi:hypothetical protein
MMNHKHVCPVIVLCKIVAIVSILCCGGACSPVDDDQQESDAQDESTPNAGEGTGQEIPLRKRDLRRGEAVRAHCRGMAQDSDVGLVARANYLASLTWLRDEKYAVDRSGLVTMAVLSNEAVLGVDSVERGYVRDAVVIVFEDEEKGLVVYAQPVGEDREPGGLSHGVAIGGIEVPNGELATMAKGDFLGFPYVEGPLSEHNIDEIWIPTGSAAVGLRYPNGVLSNFVPLERWSPDDYEL